jgi:hypothetical protein
MSSLLTVGGTLAIGAGRLTGPFAPPVAQSHDGGVLLVLCCSGLIWLGYLGLVYWVYQDASARRNDKAGLWALLVFLTPIIGLLIYLLVGRDQGTRDRPAPPPLPRRGEDPDTRRF